MSAAPLQVRWNKNVFKLAGFLIKYGFNNSNNDDSKSTLSRLYRLYCWSNWASFFIMCILACISNVWPMIMMWYFTKLLVAHDSMHRVCTITIKIFGFVCYFEGLCPQKIHTMCNVLAAPRGVTLLYGRVAIYHCKKRCDFANVSNSPRKLLSTWHQRRCIWWIRMTIYDNHSHVFCHINLYSDYATSSAIPVKW